MPLERELKLTLHGDPPDLERLTTLAGHRVTPLGLERQRNTYYDTDDRALLRTGHSLRIRRLPDRALVTLKGPDAGRAGHREREELEEVLPSPDADLDALNGELRARIDALAGGAELHPIATLETERHRFRLTGVGELALDEVEVHGRRGGPTFEFGEVELELEAGVDADALEPVLAALRAIAPLRPSSGGKLDRALAALDGTGRLARDTPWPEAAASTLAAELERLLAFEPMALAGLDPEGVHGARVAARRLRAALKVFEDGLPAHAAGAGEGLRRLGARLGAVRDLDVLMASLPGWAGGDPAALGPVLERLETERVSARRAMEAALGTKAHARLLARVRRLGRPPRRPAIPPEPLETAAPRALKKVYRRLERDGDAASALAAALERLHDLRKTVKRARYTLEFLSTAYGKPVEGAISHLKGVQQSLGEINDAAVAVEKLRGLAPAVREPGAAYALGLIVARLEGRIATARADFLRAWADYDAKDERKALLKKLG